MKKRSYPTFTQVKMAERCGLSKVYFSRVMNSDGKNLSEDQLYTACKYLEFETLTRDYTFLLFEIEKTSLDDRKHDLLQRKALIRGKYTKTESHISPETGKTVIAENLWEYYTSPDAILVHIFLSVDRFRHSLEDIARTIGISLKRLERSILILKKLGLVADTKKGYVSVAKDLHLSKDSPLYESYRSLIRLRGNDRLQKLSDKDSYNFSAIFTGDEETFDKIRNLFFEFIKQAKELSMKAPKQDVFQLTFDLFDWSKEIQ